MIVQRDFDARIDLEILMLDVRAWAMDELLALNFAMHGALLRSSKMDVLLDNAIRREWWARMMFAAAASVSIDSKVVRHVRL